jgi:hypothetical protein
VSLRDNIKIEDSQPTIKLQRGLDKAYRKKESLKWTPELNTRLPNQI